MKVTALTKPFVRFSDLVMVTEPLARYYRTRNFLLVMRRLRSALYLCNKVLKG